MVILDNTCLLAPVKNEIENPAGGIERYCHSNLPHFKHAIIQDTHSDDGTYEKLLELQKIYSNLIVPKPIDFKGFSHVRNHLINLTLDLPNCSYVCFLDADDVLCSEKPQDDFAIIKRIMKENPADLYSFHVLEIPNSLFEKPYFDFYTAGLRLFNKNARLKFKNVEGENLQFPKDISKRDIKKSEVVIKHFVPSYKKRLQKLYNRFHDLDNGDFELPSLKEKKAKQYKKFNPRRNKYM